MKRYTRSVLFLALGTALALAPALVWADSGSAAFDQYVQSLGQRMRQIDNSGYWVSSAVDRDAFERYLAAIGESAARYSGQAPTQLALESSEQPLRTFNTYLRYLGQRIRADAGAPGPLMEIDTGSALMDRYVEALNFRLQVLREASDTTGF